MFKQALTYLQYLLPKSLITTGMGWLAESTTPWIKNSFIKQFMKLYNISLAEAVVTNPADFINFNDFFTRKLKPGARTIAAGQSEIACPVDGTTAQAGSISHDKLMQAKGMYFSLESLLGHDECSHLFTNGAFATLYLAPHNYHRIHMPISGKLVKTIYIPGQLFSVNKMTSRLIPNLYARNERLVCLFDTASGPMAMILVGALIVGSIQTVWMDSPIRSSQIVTETFANGIELNKGDEMGLFKLGSTVVLLFAADKIKWNNALTADSVIQLGQNIGELLTH